jgi:hypothetical protein
VNEKRESIDRRTELTVVLHEEELFLASALETKKAQCMVAESK